MSLKEKFGQKNKKERSYRAEMADENRQKAVVAHSSDHGCKYCLGKPFRGFCEFFKKCDRRRCGIPGYPLCDPLCRRAVLHHYAAAPAQFVQQQHVRAMPRQAGY